MRGMQCYKYNAVGETQKGKFPISNGASVTQPQKPQRVHSRPALNILVKVIKIIRNVIWHLMFVSCDGVNI